MIRYTFLLVVVVSVLSALTASAIGREKMTVTIKSIELELFLNTDGSVESTINVKAVASKKWESKNGTIAIQIPIADNELIDQKSIQIVDLRNPDMEFALTANMNPSSCLGKYYFNAANNDVEFCIPSSEDNDLAYEISYKYEALDYPGYDACIEAGRVRRPPIATSFSAQEQPFFFSYALSADRELVFNTSEKCPDGWEKIYIDNGYKCVSKKFVFPNRSSGFVLNATLRGKSRNFIRQQEEEALANTETKTIMNLTVKNAVNTAIMYVSSLIIFIVTVSKRSKHRLAEFWEKNTQIIIATLVLLIVAHLLWQILW